MNPDQDQCDTTASADDLPDVPFTTGPMFDALSSGEPPDENDEVAVLLAAWRDHITSDLPATDTDIRPAIPAPVAPVIALRPGLRRARRLARTLTATAAAIVLLLTGVGIGSWRSTPNSPLWPVARVLYPDHTDVIAIEGTISQARQSLAAGHPDQAATLINAARHQLAVANVDETTAERIRTEIDVLVLALAAYITQIQPGPLTQTGPPAPSTTPLGPSRPTPPTNAPNPAPTGSHAPTQKPPIVGELPALPLPGLPLPSSPAPNSPTPSAGANDDPLLDIDPILPGLPGIRIG